MTDGPSQMGRALTAFEALGGRSEAVIVVRGLSRDVLRGHMSVARGNVALATSDATRRCCFRCLRVAVKTVPSQQQVRTLSKDVITTADTAGCSISTIADD